MNKENIKKRQNKRKKAMLQKLECYGQIALNFKTTLANTQWQRSKNCLRVANTIKIVNIQINMRIFSCFCMYALCSMQPTKNVAKNLCSLFKCLQRIASFSTLCLPFKFTFFGNAEAFLYKFLLPLFQRSFSHFIFSSSHHFRCQSHYNVLL